MKLAELFVDIIGNPRPLYATLGSVKSALTGFGRGLSIPAIGMLGGASGSLLGLTAVGAAMGYAIKTAGDLEKAFSQVRKTTGLTATELAVLRTRIEQMSTSMAGVSIDQLLEVATVAGRMGIQGVDDISAFTEALAKIHIAMDDIPIEELAMNMSRTLNVFKLGPEMALSFGSALNKLDDSAAATGQEILAVTQMLSGAASTMGLSVQKTLALAAALKDAGVHTEVAGTAFSHILRGMATDTAKYAKLTGKSVQDFSAVLRADPLEAIKLVIGALNSLDKLEAPKALDKLGLDGQRTAGSLLQLARTVGKLDTYVGMANSEWKTHASIEREVAIQAQNTWSQLQRLGNNIRLNAEMVGSLFLPAIKDMADVLGVLFTTMREGFPSFQATLAPYFESLTSAVKVVKFEIQNIVTLWDLMNTHFAIALHKMADSFETFAGTITDKIKSIASTPFFYIQAGASQVFGTKMPDMMQKQPAPRGEATGKGAIDLLESHRQELEAKLLKALVLGPDDVPKVNAPNKAKAKEAQEGTKKSPFDSEKKAEFLDLTSFAKKLQEGVFGKDDSGKQTAAHTADIAKGVQTLIQQGGKNLFSPLPPGVFG